MCSKLLPLTEDTVQKKVSNETLVVGINKFFATIQDIARTRTATSEDNKKCHSIYDFTMLFKN